MEGDKIAAVGELDGVKDAVAGRQITIDDRFAGKVIMPGFIEHHIHPLLGAMTMSAEVIAIEDWAIPGRYSKAATSNEEYVARLNQALAALAGKPRDDAVHLGLSSIFPRPDPPTPIGRDQPEPPDGGVAPLGA